VKDALVAVNRNLQGDGVYMDRDGNVYVVYGGLYPDGAKYKEGWGGGGLFKFRGLGGRYPVGQFRGGNLKGDQIPADAIKLRMKYPDTGGLVGVTGALWVYGGGATNQSFGDCNCWHTRFWLDRFARSWLPTMQVSSVHGRPALRVGRGGLRLGHGPVRGGSRQHAHPRGGALLRRRGDRARAMNERGPRAPGDRRILRRDPVPQVS
jgi:hypothetical protein